MYKHLFLLALLILSTTAQALPSQLNVVGIVPGVSTKAEVVSKKDGKLYVIGGYKIICIPEFSTEGLLQQLFCVTGEKYGSVDATKETYRPVSNIEVHETLAKGFKKKFGKPYHSEDFVRSTGLGVRVNSNLTEWKDKKGNKLTLLSMSDKIDEGLLLLQSAEKIKQDEADTKKEEEDRKF